MNMEIGSSCPMTGCSDQQGTLPSCGGLAVSLVPFQQRGAKKYSQQDALVNGTLFPGLNLPFYLKMEGGPVPATPLAELQALEFVIHELGLYLDTHPEDSEAFDLFQQYSKAEQTARAAYEAKNGPLTRQAAAQFQQYRWLESPWPWCVGEREEQ